MLRQLFAALLALVTIAAAAPSAPLMKPSWWVPNAGSGWIGIDPADDFHILIPVELNGNPAWALVDTGFEAMTLSRRFADAHRLRLTPWGTATGFGGPTRFLFASGVSMAIGSVHTEAPATFAVADLDALSTRFSHPIDVVLGFDLLAHVGWEVDEDHHRIRFVPSGTLAMRHAVPLNPGPNGIRMVTNLGLKAGLEPAAVDTGSDDDLMVDPSLAARMGLRKVTDMSAAGTGGVFVVAIGRASSVSIGGLTIPDLEVSVSDEIGRAVDPQLKALVGMGLLRRYNLMFDMAAGGLQLTPRTTPAAPEPKSTTGIQYDDADGPIRIVHVMEHSPAAAAGIRQGDAICAVNGARVPPQHWGRAAPGTHYILQLCGGRTKELTARAFY